MLVLGMCIAPLIAAGAALGCLTNKAATEQNWAWRKGAPALTSPLSQAALSSPSLEVTKHSTAGQAAG